MAAHARRPEPPCGHKMLAECPLTARDWEAVYAAYLGFLHACRMISHAAHERASSTLPDPHQEPPMPDVRIATRRIAKGGAPAGPDAPAIVELQAHWVDVDGVRLTAHDHGLRSVTYHADGNSVSTVTIVLAVSSFASVSKDDGA